jgi:hypothetical protein
MQTLPGNIIFNVSFRDDKYAKCSTLRAMDDSSGWGFSSLLSVKKVKKDALEFQEKAAMKQGDVIYVPEELRPTQKFIIHGVITVRFVNADDWRDHYDDMKQFPEVYLYMHVKSFVTGNRIYPQKPRMMTQKERMDRMLSQASSADEGIYTFLVGPQQVAMTAHANIVNSLLSVPLLNAGMVEGSTKTVRLPEEDEFSFRIFLKYLYTLEVSEVDMWDHSYRLLGLANKYNIEMLHYMCEWYLCWNVQVLIFLVVNFVFTLTYSSFAECGGAE